MGSEWRWRTLGELTDNFDSIRVPVKEPDRRPGPYPYYGASGVVDHVDSYLYDGEYLLVAEDGENLRTRTTPVAFLARGRFWVNNHAHVIRGNSHADTRFLMYALAAADINGYLSGSAMPKLTQASLNRIPLFAPGLAEQQRIADILSALDDKIELNRRMSQTLEAMARALFKSWFVDFDPARAKAEGRDPGLPHSLASLFPDSLWDSDLGEVPEGWTIAPFTETVDVVGGGTPKTAVADYWNGDIPWFSIADAPRDTDPWVVDTEKKITHAGLENSSARILPAGTTIVTARGTVGRVALVGTPMAMNQSCYGLQSKSGRREYFTYFSTRHLVSALQQRAHGSVFDTITRDSLAGVSIAVPSPEVVDAFEAAVGPILLKARAGVLESQLLQTTRDELLVHLLAGPGQGAAHLQSLDGGIA